MTTAGGQGRGEPVRGAAVDAHHAQGLLIGDHGTQVSNFFAAETVSWPVRVGAVPALADCYQPRDESDALERAVDPGGTAVLTQVLSGLGGVGKSQLAAAYARSVAGRVELLMWVTATSRDAILGTYAQAARQLGYRVPGGVEQAAGWFLSWLQIAGRDWLVVLDDVADPADLRGLWPDGLRGRTLVTTRRTDAVLSNQGRRRIDVGLFTPEDARRYLAAKLDADPGSGRMPDVDELAADLGYLPLALAQAAAFILDRDETCAGYRARLADRRRRLSELFPEDALADDYRATVAATWSISIEAADQLVPRGLCRPLLQVASVLDPNGFPIDVVQTAAVISYVAAHLATAEGQRAPEGAALSGQDCRDALRNLARLSLLSVDPAGGPSGVRVHALVQRAAVEHLDHERVTSIVHAAASALPEVWPDIERDPQLGQVLRANTATLAGRQVDALWEPDGHPVLWRAGRSLGECGLVSAAVDYWTQMVRDADRVLGADHPDTLSARHNGAMLETCGCG
ncbi:MAG: NB-ARC domain-containing protein [Actinomycetota bacterium]|nr:NB-ARC domain-containing protein [Actinomycetota bacterium]